MLKINECSVVMLSNDFMTAWNKGNLVAACALYANDATFITPGNITHGRLNILNQYKDTFPESAAMGSLELNLIEFRSAGNGIMASAAVEWALKHTDGKTATGFALLTYVLEKGNIRIAQNASV